jgi:hypothetical protein
MTIALRGAAVVPTGNPTTGFTVAIPAQVLADDLCFLTLTSRDSTGAGTLSVTDNDTGGNAWAKIGNSTDHKATLWYKRATSGTASKTVTVANAVGSAAGVLKCFSGASTDATPYTNVVVETNASANETHAGFTPTNADSMVCAAVFNTANDNAVTSLSFATLGATTAAEKLSTGGSDCGNIFGHALQSGAATGTGSLTWAQTDGATYSITWAIAPLALTPIDGALSLALTDFTLAATGVVPVQGALALTVGDLALAATGTVSDPVVNTDGVLTLTVGGLGLVAIGGVQLAGALSLTISALTLSAAGTVADPPAAPSARPFRPAVVQRRTRLIRPPRRAF